MPKQTVFNTHVGGELCQCRVVSFYESVPLIVTGMGFGDCEPPEDSVFDFELIDETGKRSTHLESMLTEDDINRIFDEFVDFEEMLAG